MRITNIGKRTVYVAPDFAVKKTSDDDEDIALLPGCVLDVRLVVDRDLVVDADAESMVVSK